MGCDLMPTIKRKVEMNLPQLIEWAWDNKIRSKTYRSLGGAEIEFSEGDVVRVYRTDSDDTFAVEFEEEITEDTVIPEMLVIFSDGVTDLTNNKRLNDLSGTNLKSAYIMNDDLRLILIWRDGRLVN